MAAHKKKIEEADEWRRLKKKKQNSEEEEEVETRRGRERDVTYNQYYSPYNYDIQPILFKVFLDVTFHFFVNKFKKLFSKNK